MYEWNERIQIVIDEIDKCIMRHDDEDLTLRCLSRKLGYSEFYVTRKFKEISGMQFKDYLRKRRLAFALKELRDSKKSILNIAFDYGFPPTRRLQEHLKQHMASRQVCIVKSLYLSFFVQKSFLLTATF